MVQPDQTIPKDEQICSRQDALPVTGLSAGDEKVEIEDDQPRFMCSRSDDS